MEQIEILKTFSGFKLNKRNTKIITKHLTKQEEDNVTKITGCELVIDSVKYLGIKISGKSEMLFKDNYKDLWKKYKKTWENELN